MSQVHLVLLAWAFLHLPATASDGPEKTDPPIASEQRFRQSDKRGDGKLSRDELLAAVFNRLDSDEDGFVTPEELGRVRNRTN